MHCSHSLIRARTPCLRDRRRRARSSATSLERRLHRRARRRRATASSSQIANERRAGAADRAAERAGIERGALHLVEMRDQRRAARLGVAVVERAAQRARRRRWRTRARAPAVFAICCTHAARSGRRRQHRARRLRLDAHVGRDQRDAPVARSRAAPRRRSDRSDRESARPPRIDGAMLSRWSPATADLALQCGGDRARSASSPIPSPARRRTRRPRCSAALPPRPPESGRPFSIVTIGLRAIAVRAKPRDRGDRRGVALRIARHERGVDAGDRIDRAHRRRSARRVTRSPMSFDRPGRGRRSRDRRCRSSRARRRSPSSRTSPPLLHRRSPRCR